MTLDEYIKALELIRNTHGGELRVTQPYRGYVIDAPSPVVKFLSTDGSCYLGSPSSFASGEKVVKG